MKFNQEETIKKIDEYQSGKFLEEEKKNKKPFYDFGISKLLSMDICFNCGIKVKHPAIYCEKCFNNKIII